MLSNGNANVNARSRDWCFTINDGHRGDLTEEQVETRLKALECVYMVVQAETGEAGENDHLQGYVCFKAARTMSAILRSFPCHAHLKPRYRDSSISQAVNYCKKPESRRRLWWETGTQPMDQGVKRTLAEACATVKESGSVAVAKDAPEVFVQHWRGLERLEEILNYDKIPQMRNMEVIVLVGTAGCGKSYYGEHFAARDEIYQCGDTDPLWLNGYTNQKVLVIEDMSGKIPFRELLRLLDKYMYNMPKKGGHVWAAYEHVIITANQLPENWYGPADSQWSNTPGVPPGPLQRRITSTHQGSGVWGVSPVVWDPPLPPTLLERQLDQEVVDLMDEVEVEAAGVVQAEPEVFWGGAADGQAPEAPFVPPPADLVEEAQLLALGVVPGELPQDFTFF